MGLAVLARARGQRAGAGPWHVLAADFKAAAEEVLLSLEQAPDPELLEAVVQAAMGPEPATAAPSWAAPFWRKSSVLKMVGKEINEKRLAPVLGSRYTDASDRLKGLAALAVAMSRSLESLRALAEYLPVAQGQELVRMGNLAQAVVESGEPTRMRAELKRLLKLN